MLGQTVRERLIGILSEHLSLDPFKIKHGDLLVSDLGLDPVDGLLLFLSEIREVFGLKTDLCDFFRCGKITEKDRSVNIIFFIFISQRTVDRCLGL